VFQDGWKPLNYGFVLATLKFCDVAEFLFKNGFDFVLGQRFSQDATENIFSQIRRKEGSMPTALKALRAIRLISVSQFVSDVTRSSYMSNSDQFLLDFCKEKSKSILETKSLSVVPNNVSKSEISKITFQYFSLEDFSGIMTNHDINCTYYIAGSTTNAVTKHVCTTCIKFLSNQNLPETEFIRKAKLYTSGANQGGLKDPCLEILSLVCHCEYYFKIHKNLILRNENTELIQCLIEDIQILFPNCCNVKQKIVKHFFTVRSYCLNIFQKTSINVKLRMELRLLNVESVKLF